MSKIFISYSSKDKLTAKKLEEKLKKDGAEVFVDYHRIKPGDTLPGKISEALEWCDTFLLLWSKHAQKSDWVKLEWENALSLRKKIIPCLLDNTILPAILSRDVWVHFENFDRGYYEICKAFGLQFPAPAPLSYKVRWRRVLTIAIAPIMMSIAAVLSIQLLRESPEEEIPKTGENTAAQDKKTQEITDMGHPIVEFVLINRPESEGGNFYISKYEITNEEYMQFVHETGHAPPPFIDNDRFNKPRQPVVGVSFHDAIDYCNWLSEKFIRQRYRLPTEEEWVFVAYGTEKRDYPWNDISPTSDHGNYNNNVGSPTYVGSYPKGVTPEGVFDIAGNVWEWCNNWADYNKTQRVLRGGSWKDPDHNAGSAFRNGESPSTKRDDIGFRLVRTDV